MSAKISNFYKDFLIKNKMALFEKARTYEMFFNKRMKNLVYGTNRSIFLTTSGKEDEGAEKWSPGKPISRVNIRATISNYFPESVLDSIFINTYRDERELIIYLLADVSSAMYPSSLMLGLDDPFAIKISFSLYVQHMMLNLARSYNAQVRVVYYPFDLMHMGKLNMNQQSSAELSAFLSLATPPAASPLGAIDLLVKKKVKHAIVALISDERAFTHPDRKALMELCNTFSITNDLIYFPICTNYKRIFGAVQGGIEIEFGGDVRFVADEDDAREMIAEIEESNIKNFSALNKVGVQSCAIDMSNEAWEYSVIDFFRSRLVCK